MSVDFITWLFVQCWQNNLNCSKPFDHVAIMKILGGIDSCFQAKLYIHTYIYSYVCIACCCAQQL